MPSNYEQLTRSVNERGDVRWSLPNGALHRLDGPAMELASGTKAWGVNGKLHRLAGPAIEWADGSKWWYIEGQQLTEQQWTLEVCRRFRQTGTVSSS